MEENVIRGATLAVAAGLMVLSSSYVLGLDEKKQQDGLIANIGKAKITLQQGLGMAETQGQPISGKFELENDTEFQLSVFTLKTGKFAEVVVDYGNGKLAKPEAITEGDDLKEAKSEQAAMAKAKISLKAAVEKIVGQNAGYRAISIFPSLKDGHPIGTVVLLKDKEFKTVEISLEQ
jgi:hypothetical protein